MIPMDLENPKKISNFFFGMTHIPVSTHTGQTHIPVRIYSNTCQLTPQPYYYCHNMFLASGG